MKNYFEEIKSKIEKSIKVEDLQIIDNSYKHKTHRFYQPDKYHLKLKIKSMYLSSFPRVKAQKKIMKVLENDLKTKIHALEINIEQ
tara:strand:+ start:2560 stop:2817 length:258 start_codon:yes stop_codon:yes gene_type:complete